MILRCTGIALSLVVAITACSSETAILIEVTRTEQSPAVQTLRFTIATTNDDSLDLTLFQSMDVELDEVVGDILVEPHRLLVRQGNSSDPSAFVTDDSQVLVAVTGLGSDRVNVGFAAMPSPIRFVDGEILLFKLVLGDMNVIEGENACIDYVDEAGYPVSISLYGDRDCDRSLDDDDCEPDDSSISPLVEDLVCDTVDPDCVLDCIVVGDDQDRDGSNACGAVPVGDNTCQLIPWLDDCNDLEPAISPSEFEICDGLENSCDGQMLDRILCFGQESGGCREGYQLCGEEEGSTAPVPQCLLTSGDVPQPLCDRLSDCVADNDPIGCMVDDSATEPVACEVLYTITPDGSWRLCPNRDVRLIERVPLLPPASCRTMLHGGKIQEQYNIALVDTENGLNEPVDGVFGSCNVELKVSARNALPPRSDRVIVSTGVGDMPIILGITIRPMLVQDCPEKGLFCAGLPIVLGP